MGTKSWAKNRIFQIRISFGRSKAGMEFKYGWDLDGHTFKAFGDGLGFFQSEVSTSPFIWHIGAVEREECWNKTAKITQLVSVLYKTKDCKINQGF